jgi:hypothetical protein
MKHTIFAVIAASALVAFPALGEDKPAAKPATAAPAAKPAAAPAAPAAAAKPAASASTKPAPTSGEANMEILKQKLKADKKLLVAANMELSDAESKTFWPIYESYQTDLAKLNQRISTVVDNYLGAYDKGAISNDLSKKLLQETLSIEKAELDLKRALVTKLDKSLPPYKVARYVQIENKVRAVIKYELAAQIPLVQ